MLLERQATYRFDDFEVNLGARTLRRDGHRIEMERHTFALLALLIAHAPEAVSEEVLLAALWPHTEVEESNLGQHIFLLRRALTGARRGEAVIASGPGHAYRFAAELEEVPADAASAPEHTKDDEDEPVLPGTHAFGTVGAGSRMAGSRGRHVAERRAAARSKGSGELRARKAIALDDPEESGETKSWRSLVGSTGARIGLALLALLVLGTGAILAWRHIHAKPAAYLHVVVADIRNPTGDPQFDGSLRTALAGDLRQSPYLILPGEDRVVDALVAMNTAGDNAAGGAAKTGGIARELCSRLKGEAYIEGEIRRLGAKYLIAVEAYGCGQGKELASVRGVADSADGVLPVLDRMALAVRRQLGEPEESLGRFRQPFFAPGTGSMAALKAYSDGVGLELDGKSSEAIGLLERATGIDTQFALAYEDLGLAYLGQAGSGPAGSGVAEASGSTEADPSPRAAAEANLTRAYQLRNGANAFDRFNIVARYEYLVTGDYPAAMRNFNEAIESYPRVPVFLSGLADLENRMGRSALALDPARRAVAAEPDNAIAYEVLAEAQMRLGQFEEAALTCRRAVSRQIDTARIHSLLLQIAFLRLDQPGIDEQLAGAHGRPQEPQIEAGQGRMELAQGKVKSAQAHFAHAAQALRAQGMGEQADALLSAMPRRYAELGLTDLADAQIGRLPQTAEAADVAVARAELGGTEHAEAMLAKALSEHPASTLWSQIDGPQVRAAIALNQHEPDAAIAALQPAEPYDLAAFDLPLLRGRAYLMAHQPQQAEAEFHKILDHPGIDPLSPDYALAQLGVARALVAEGKLVEAGFAYKIVLQIWKDADADLPRLREAKAEYARVGGGTGTGVRLKPSASKPRHR